MVEGLLAADPTDEARVASIPKTVDTRKQRLAEILSVKLEQGYQVESQGDTEAVLFTPGRRQWFGLSGGGVGARMIISVDEQGTATTRKLSPSG
jgi:anti-sigma factor RsiW